jgi:hypothetical protein
MRTRKSLLLRKLTLTAAAAMLLIGMGNVTTALADTASERCPGGATPASVESKTCPPTSKRPALTVKRACCTLKGDRKSGTSVHCNHFPHCPNNSPS